MINTLPKRIADKIEQITESGCWIWRGRCLPTGYGISWYDKKRIYAHRLMYQLFIGPIADTLTIDHLCRVRCCVNPHHMEAVTQGQNTLRGNSFSGINARRTHCPQAHPYSQDNTYTDPTGARHCKICKRAAFLRFKRRVEREITAS